MCGRKTPSNVSLDIKMNKYKEKKSFMKILNKSKLKK